MLSLSINYYVVNFLLIKLSFIMENGKTLDFGTAIKLDFYKRINKFKMLT